MLKIVFKLEREFDLLLIEANSLVFSIDDNSSKSLKE